MNEYDLPDIMARFYADEDCENDCASLYVADLRAYTADYDPEPGIARHYHRVLIVLWTDDTTGERKQFYEETSYKQLAGSLAYLPITARQVDLDDLRHYGRDHYEFDKL